MWFKANYCDWPFRSFTTLLYEFHTTFKILQLEFPRWVKQSLKLSLEKLSLHCRVVVNKINEFFLKISFRWNVKCVRKSSLSPSIRAEMAVVYRRFSFFWSFWLQLKSVKKHQEKSIAQRPSGCRKFLNFFKQTSWNNCENKWTSYRKKIFKPKETNCRILST